MQTVTLDGHSLTLEAVEAVAWHHAPVAISPDAMSRVRHSRAFIEAQVQAGKVLYGVTTGFGPNADIVIPVADAQTLQRNLLLSHATGVGTPFSVPLTRAIMLIRLNTLLAGYSGIRPQTVELLRDLINHNIHPVIPSQGSVGASGDLCPLSHMALPLIGEGEVFAADGSKIAASEALASAGLQPLELSYKEGLALNNGTTVMAALGVEGVLRARKLIAAATGATALIMEALCARRQALDERLHALRRQQGQVKIAARLREITSDSTCIGLPHETILAAGQPPREEEIGTWLSQGTRVKFALQKRTPQDAYSIRCAPQVLGASLDAIDYVAQTIENELNAVVDNPLLFPETNDVISGGNFHGQPLALVLDHLKLAVHEISSLLERQVAKLTDPANNDSLPAFLAENAGLHSGLMIPQYAAAALVSEGKVLVHPASADTIPTSANREDHVSMGPIAGRQALEILGNAEKVLVIQLMTAAQALDMRLRQMEHWGLAPEPGAYVKLLQAAIRQRVTYNAEDRLLYRDIEALLAAYQAGELS